MRKLLFAAALLAACGSSEKNDDAGAGGAGGGDGGGRCSSPTAVACDDAMIQEMALQATVSDGAITNEAAGGVFTSVVDATAGGAFANPPGPYVYARFTDDGLVKVEVSDEGALDSMDWDIAFRRYVIRLNAGDSGPSCVTAARLPPGTTFDGAAAPADDAFHADDFYTDSCELVPDGSGLPSSPATVLASYYSYPGCVDMTGNVYVVQRADGRRVKLEITGYYWPLEKQAYCHDSAAAPDAPNGSGTVSLRWAFVE